MLCKKPGTIMLYGGRWAVRKEKKTVQLLHKPHISPIVAVDMTPPNLKSLSVRKEKAPYCNMYNP